MRRKAAGYFVDPATNQLVVILNKKGESDETARKRVADAHALSPEQVSAVPPEAGGNPGWKEVAVDMPDRPPRPAGLTGPGDYNTSEGVSRYQKSFDQHQATAGQSSSLAGKLAPSPSMLGNLEEPKARSL